MLAFREAGEQRSMSSATMQHVPDLEDTLIVHAAAPRPDGPQIELVKEGDTEAESEIGRLLRRRLRATGIVLFGAVMTFYIRGFVVGDVPAHPLRGTMTASLCGMIAILAGPQRFTLRHLRLMELALIGMTGLFVGLYEYDLILYRLQQGGGSVALAGLQGCMTYAFGTMALYTMFIPNTWRRAAAVVIPLSLLPIVVLLLLRVRHAEVQTVLDHLSSDGVLLDYLLMLLLGRLRRSTERTRFTNCVRKRSRLNNSASTICKGCLAVAAWVRFISPSTNCSGVHVPSRSSVPVARPIRRRPSASSARCSSRLSFRTRTRSTFLTTGIRRTARFITSWNTCRE
jgi:hypothetical protein